MLIEDNLKSVRAFWDPIPYRMTVQNRLHVGYVGTLKRDDLKGTKKRDGPVITHVAMRDRRQPHAEDHRRRSGARCRGYSGEGRQHTLAGPGGAERRNAVGST